MAGIHFGWRVLTSCVGVLSLCHVEISRGVVTCKNKSISCDNARDMNKYLRAPYSKLHLMF